MSRQNPSKTNIMVVGRNYGNILVMTRALGQAGYAVDVLRLYKAKPSPVRPLSGMNPDAYSKYAEQFSECIVGGNPHNAVDALMKTATKGKKTLLIPVDDYSCRIIDAFYDQLKEWYIMPNIGDRAGIVTNLMDKHLQKELALGLGVPVLESVLIKSEGGEFDIPSEVKYPCFIKPNASFNSTKAGMRKCESRAQLESALLKFAADGDFQIMAEEFAEIKNEYAVLGVSAGGKTIAPGLFRTVQGGHKERKGVAMTGVTEPCSKFQDLINQCIGFVNSLDYTGLFDIDLIETVDGKVYFIEINFRAGASVHVFTETAVNMPGMLADYFLKGIPLDPNCTVGETGKLFLSEKILLEEYARGDIDKSEIMQYMNDADIFFIKDREDPKPYEVFRRFFTVAGCMRWIYRMKNKSSE